VVTV
jgi:hypothetical protein